MCINTVKICTLIRCIHYKVNALLKHCVTLFMILQIHLNKLQCNHLNPLSSPLESKFDLNKKLPNLSWDVNHA